MEEDEALFFSILSDEIQRHYSELSKSLREKNTQDSRSLKIEDCPARCLVLTIHLALIVGNAAFSTHPLADSTPIRRLCHPLV